MARIRNQAFENTEVATMGFESEALIHKKVKNEDCSSLFIENKGSKKVLLIVC